MSKGTFVYACQADFDTGTADGAAWCEGAVRLLPGCHTGQWTGPVQPVSPFDWLVPSWNASVPPGAGVRAAVRVQTDAGWTPWLDWGLWSPLCPSHRAPPLARRCADGVVRGGILRSEQAAAAFQLRLSLQADETGRSPEVYLAAASVRLLHREDESGEPLYHRVSPVPAYSQMNRDPRLAGHIGGAVCAAMLMNRWGEDLLPEKVAHICLSPEGLWDDPAYLAAAMGTYGYQATAAFASVPQLKKELKAGCACAAAMRGTPGFRWVAVRGFDTDENGGQWVLVNDPDAATDTAAEQTMPLDVFRAGWTGLALYMHARDEARAAWAPAWAPGELRPGEVPGTWALLRRGERVSLPVDLCQKDGMCCGTVCYAVKDGRAYASTAQRQFFYTDVAPTGDILLDTAGMPAGTKLAVYVVQPGQTVTACLTL